MTRVKITKELILNLHSLNLSKKQVATHFEIPISILNQGLEQLQLKKLKFNKVDLEVLPDLELPEVINTHTFTMYEVAPVIPITVSPVSTPEFLRQPLLIANDAFTGNSGQYLTQTNTGDLTWSEPIINTGNYPPETVVVNGRECNQYTLGSTLPNDVERGLRGIESNESEEVEWQDEELEEFLAEQYERDRQERENHENWLVETFRQEERDREEIEAHESAYTPVNYPFENDDAPDREIIDDSDTHLF